MKVLTYVISLLFIATACTPIPVSKAVVPTNPKGITLPAHPKKKLPVGEVKEEWIMPLDRGECISYEDVCPIESGIFMSENRANRFGLYAIGYEELVKKSRANNKELRAYIIETETQIRNANKEIDRLRPNYFTQYGPYVGLVLGLAAGLTAATITFK